MICVFLAYFYMYMYSIYVLYVRVLAYFAFCVALGSGHKSKYFLLQLDIYKINIDPKHDNRALLFISIRRVSSKCIYYSFTTPHYT